MSYNISVCCKYVFPLLVYCQRLQKSIIFIGTDYIFVKTLLNHMTCHETLIVGHSGIFSNITSLNTGNIRKIPALAIFFSMDKNRLLLIDIKKKNIPVISFLKHNDSSVLIDYPIFVNNNFFYTVYFFSQYIYKLFYFIDAKN